MTKTHVDFISRLLYLHAYIHTLIGRLCDRTVVGGGAADDIDTSHVRTYQIYRGMSPTTSNRLEVFLFCFSRLRLWLMYTIRFDDIRLFYKFATNRRERLCCFINIKHYVRLYGVLTWCQGTIITPHVLVRTENFRCTYILYIDTIIASYSLSYFRGFCDHVWYVWHNYRSNSVFPICFIFAE